MRRVVRVLPWILFAFVIASWAPGLYYDQFSDELTRTSDRVWAGSFLAFPLVGLFLAARMPSNFVGWLFLVGPALIGGGVSATEYGEAINSPSLQGHGDTLLLVGVLCLLGSIVLFPDGRYANRWFKWLHIGSLSGLAAASLLLPGESPITAGLVLANFLLPIVALTFRAMRGDGATRRQIAGPILVTVVGLLAMSVVYSLIPDEVDLGWIGVVPSIVLTVGVPISIGVSVTRYRLYEIDRIISRTVSYALVIGLLGAVFAAGVVWIPSALGIGDSPLVVAFSTLAVAALFNPVRRRMQVWVDRRFNRSRYDAERVMDEFAGSLRDRVDADEVVEGWLDVVDSTMQPAAAGVWVKGES